jgi:phosphatidylinositol alpha-mannosyltransferase
VTRHIEALAESLMDQGHHVRVLAPYDPPDRLSAVLHRGAKPQQGVTAPDYLVSLGRSVGLHANGNVSNLAIGAYALSTAQRELRTGGYDVVHVHEPLAPVAPYLITDWMRLPLVGTFHTYNENRLSNGIAAAVGAGRMLNHLHVRVAVSEAAAWTARRFFGGRYRIIRNGVRVDSARAAAAASTPMGERLRIVFVGQAVERKGLPVLLRAFEALRDHIPCDLTVIGPSREELAPMMLDSRQVRILGKVDDRTKQEELEQADVLCAPSLRGESFGLVLAEGFAAGLPVVASNIAGYRDVVQDGVTGLLTPVGDPQALAEALRDLYEEPERRMEMAKSAVRDVERYAWPRVAAELASTYEDAAAMPVPEGALARASVRLGLRPADLGPIVLPKRLPSLQPQPPAARRSKALRLARRGGVAALSVTGAVLGWLALQKIGLASIGSALLHSSPVHVLLALAVMCCAMTMRGFSWYAILKAALPRARVRLSDAMQGTFIGVLMSSTLPARLGEPSRALVVARRTGRPRDHFPVVLGTVVSQTLINLLALVILGAIMFTSVNFFSGHETALLAVAILPALLLAVLLGVPAVLRTEVAQRFTRLQVVVSQVRAAITRVRDGLTVFRMPRLGLIATFSQLAAWALQAVSCYLLLVALGLSSHAGFAAAAAVLFAVNVTAVLPATPANLGVFQAATAAVLHAGWHVGFGAGVAYGVILQAVELSTALLMGMPALLKEGMSWKEVKMRAMHATPVKLAARPAKPGSPEPARAES